VLGDERLNVFFGDATAQTGARNFGQVDVIIFGDAAHQRAGANAFLLSLGIFQNCALLRSLQAFLFVGRKICRDLVCQLGFRRFGAGRFRRFGGRGFAGISCSRGLGWTVAPACTLMSCRVPEAGAGISASTLSVEISNSGSSR
jgi:hypothetical protein